MILCGLGVRSRLEKGERQRVSMGDAATPGCAWGNRTASAAEELGWKAELDLDTDPDNPPRKGSRRVGRKRASEMGVASRTRNFLIGCPQSIHNTCLSTQSQSLRGPSAHLRLAWQRLLGPRSSSLSLCASVHTSKLNSQLNSSNERLA